MQPSLVQCFDNSLSLFVGTLEPIGAPNTMNDPTSRLKYFLSQAVSVSHPASAMILSSIAFDTQQVSAVTIGISNRKVNVEATNADLMIDLESTISQGIGHLLLKYAVGFAF